VRSVKKNKEGFERAHLEKVGKGV